MIAFFLVIPRERSDRGNLAGAHNRHSFPSPEIAALTLAMPISIQNL